MRDKILAASIGVVIGSALWYTATLVGVAPPLSTSTDALMFWVVTFVAAALSVYLLVTDYPS